MDYKFCYFYKLKLLTKPTIRSGGSGASTPPLEMKMDKQETAPLVNGISEDEKEVDKDETPPVDIMAQQLKFVACLKILMEELSTLATGFEVDGESFTFCGPT